MPWNIFVMCEVWQTIESRLLVMENRTFNLRIFVTRWLRAIILLKREYVLAFFWMNNQQVLLVHLYFNDAIQFQIIVFMRLCTRYAAPWLDSYWQVRERKAKKSIYQSAQMQLYQTASEQIYRCVMASSNHNGLKGRFYIGNFLWGCDWSCGRFQEYSSELSYVNIK